MKSMLDGRVAVVTGAASGIGAGIARRFVEEGARVVVADLQVDAGQAVATDLGSCAHFVRCDVTQEADIAAAVGAAVDRFGGLDVMCNNAGVVGVIGSIVATDADVWDRTVAILMRSVFLGTKHAAGAMIAGGRRGSIISTASTAGVRGGLGPHCYTACKHAVIGLTRSAASELARHGIRVNAVAPGNTATAMTAAVLTGDPTAIDQTGMMIAAMNPLGVSGSPADIAAAYAFLASDEARYITGHCLLVDGGETAIAGSGHFHTVPSAITLEAGRVEATPSPAPAVG